MKTDFLSEGLLADTGLFKGCDERFYREDIPGTDCQQLSERDENGMLVRISIGEHSYVERRGDELVFGDDFVRMTNFLVPDGLLRTVKTAQQSWQEFYRTDAQRLPVAVDGMQIERDAEGRVVSCEGLGELWRYRFHQQQMIEIEGPWGTRSILRNKQGRPVQYNQGPQFSRHLSYDSQGRREGLPGLPAEFCLDAEGRLRAILNADKSIAFIFLWDGFNCLARIAGSPSEAGSQLDTVYSLDLTGTPVRLTSRTQALRVPRDAYGENLLQHKHHPGLFGGAHYAGYVWYRSRTLDSATASFNAPDPLHGGLEDPRRANGYGASLLVETPKAGPYAVCQYDPITYMDPTGEIAWYYVLSTLTWAFPNNILSWIGLEATANFWGTFFTGSWADWAKGEHWTSDRLNIGGVQRQSFFAPKGGGAFTTQHLIWAEHSYIDEKRRATVFDPGGSYQPRLYGSMLRVVPTTGAPFLLNGQRVIGNIAQDTDQLWVRSGGLATAVAPGQRTPVFLQGGLHFPFRAISIPGPQSATCTEVAPTSSVGVGTLDNNTTTSLPNSLTLVQGDLLLLEDSSAVVDIIAVVTTIAEGSNQTVRLAEAPVFSATTGITISQLLPASWTENLQNTGMPASNYLDASTTSNAYQLGDALQLDASGTLYDTRITGFETRVAIDAALSGSPATPLGIFTVTVNTGVTNNAAIASATELDFSGGTIPSAGDFIVVSDGVNSVGVVVGSGPDPLRSVDRDLGALSGPAVTWHSAARGSNLGTQTAVIGVAALTYSPVALGLVPAVNDHLLIDFGPASAVVTQLRRVTAVNYHALTVTNVVPAIPANSSFAVTRFPVGLAFSNRSLAQSLVLALEQGSVSGAVALQVYQLAGPDLAGSTFLEGNMALSGNTASRPWYSPGRGVLTPNQPVTVSASAAGAAEEALVIARVSIDIILNFPLNSSATDLEVVSMAASGFVFASQTVSPTRVRVSPLVLPAGTVMADMPVFTAGECVEISDAVSGNALGQYRIAAVPDGTLLELEAGSVLPAAGTAIGVQLLSVVPAGNGATRVAINGQMLFANSAGESHVLRADVWNRDVFPDNSVIGVVDGNRTLPCRTRSLLSSAPVAITGANQVDIGSTGFGAIVAVSDHVLLSWRDAAGAELIQTFAVTSITGTTRLNLTPQNTAVAASIAATDSDALIGVFRSGRMHDVTVPTNNQLDVSPATMGGLAVPTPRFNANAEVVVTWRNAAGRARSQEFRVTAVAGNVLDLNRSNSSPGIDVTPTDTDVTIAYRPQLEVEFTSTPATTGSLNIREIVPANTEVFARFTRETEQSLVMDNTAGLSSPSSNKVIVVPLQETGTVQNGSLGSGTGKVPEDPENPTHGEHDRRQMLVEHELRHTEQYLWWGPMFLTLLPLWPVELGLELGTNIEMPDYGTFQPAELQRVAASGATTITFADGDGGFAVDQEVQCSQGAHNVTRTLRGPADGGSGFQILNVDEFTNGTVYVRSINSFPDWYRVVHGSWFRTLTIGGLVQLAASLTHGLFFQIVGRFFYMVYRGIQMACCDDRKEGIVQGSRRQVRLSSPAERNDLINEQLLLVQEPQSFGNVVFSGIDTVVRSRVGDISDDGVLTLSAPLGWDDGTRVNIGPYQSRTPGQLLDWKKYYPARVQADNFNRLQLLSVGDDNLSLQPFDRLRVIGESGFYGMFSHVRTVISVSGAAIEVDEPVTGSGSADTELTVRVAKIGTEEPFDFLDTVGVAELTGGGWLRWASDPYGQLYAATSPSSGSFGDIIGRVGKYVMGTKAWTNPIILTSRYFMEAMTKELHNVSLEQDASEQSGDLYSPIGRVRGEANVDSTNVTMSVGDIARFWYFGFEFSDQQMSLPALGASSGATDPGFRMDDPGNHIRRDQIVYAQQAAETGTVNSWVNRGAQSGAVAGAPGLDMADIFWQKQAGNPAEVSSNAIDRRMIPTDLGLVPQSPQLQMSSSVYLAFTRATGSGVTHRATMDDNIPGGSSNGNPLARDAQDQGSQRVFYNITVNDVVVNFNNVAVAEGGSVTLLRTQSTNVSVSDEGNKQYAVLVMQPGSGPVVRASFTPNKTLSAQDPFSAGPGPFSEPFQICRWHDMDESSNSFRSGGLSQHNMHLPRDVFIPVRKLTVNVAEFPPVLLSQPASLDFTMYPAVPATLPVLQPGTSLFFPVAANVLTATQAMNYLSAPTPDVTVRPDRGFSDITPGASQQVQDFLGDGLLYELSLAADAIPEERASLTVLFVVGDTALNATITMTINIEGYFLARDSGVLAATGYQLNLGDSGVLECVQLDGVTPVNPDASNVLLTLRDGSAVPQITAAGSLVDELTFSATADQLTVNVNAAANVSLDGGFRRLLITDAGGTSKAARTIQLV